MKELVSVIVPVYKAAAYIEDTIAMVEQQTWKQWELLLIEDCSPDDSAALIRRTLTPKDGRPAAEGSCLAGSGRGEGTVERRPDPKKDAIQGILSVEEFTAAGGQRVRLVCKEQNEGAACARNTGLDLAGGRYIAFLDADDIWYPDKLEKELHFMWDRQAGFVFTAYEFGDEEARPVGKVVHVPEELRYRQALSRTVIFTTTVLLDREKIPANLLRMPVVESEDTAAWWQILRAGYTAYGLDEVLAVYRRPARSLSSNKLAAVRRVWNLYRRQERLSLPVSAGCFVMWAYRATKRRL